MSTERSFTREDASLMSKLADQLMHMSDTESSVADALLEMIAQAKILPEGVRAKDHVELNDVVTYEVVDSDARHVITLVEPHEANPRASRISLLTPVGLALVGVKIGKSSTVRLPSGKTQKIRVVSAHPELMPAA